MGVVTIIHVLGTGDGLADLLEFVYMTVPSGIDVSESPHIRKKQRLEFV